MLSLENKEKSYGSRDFQDPSGNESRQLEHSMM